MSKVVDVIWILMGTILYIRGQISTQALLLFLALTRISIAIECKDTLVINAICKEEEGKDK